MTMLPAGYLKVRERLSDAGFSDMVMESKEDVRSALHQLQIEAERLERLYRDMLSELDDADEEPCA